MAKTATPIKQAQSAAPTGFAIEDNVTVPNRTKDMQDYGLPALFASMKPGQSVLIPFDKVPVEHARTLVQRFARKGGPNNAKGKPTPVDMVTRSERAPGDTEGDYIGLRVWRNS